MSEMNWFFCSLADWEREEGDDEGYETKLEGKLRRQGIWLIVCIVWALRKDTQIKFYVPYRQCQNAQRLIATGH